MRAFVGTYHFSNTPQHMRYCGTMFHGVFTVASIAEMGPVLFIGFPYSGTGHDAYESNEDQCVRLSCCLIIKCESHHTFQHQRT